MQRVALIILGVVTTGGLLAAIGYFLYPSIIGGDPDAIVRMIFRKLG